MSRAFSSSLFAINSESFVASCSEKLPNVFITSSLESAPRLIIRLLIALSLVKNAVNSFAGLFAIISEFNFDFNASYNSSILSKIRNHLV